MTLKDFAQKENNRMTEESKKFQEEKGYPGFWIPQKGENHFSVLMDVDVREKDFGSGLRKIFRIRVKGEDKDWAVNPKNPAYRELIKRISAGQSDFVLLRTGADKQTRYEFLDSQVEK